MLKLRNVLVRCLPSDLQKETTDSSIARCSVSSDMPNTWLLLSIQTGILSNILRLNNSEYIPA